MKKIIVLGANGYIARNLIYLIHNEYEGIELSLFGIEKESIDGYDNYTQIDLTNMEEINDLDLNCDIIFMFVGKTGSANGFEDYNSFIDINEKTLLNLLSAYRKQKSSAKIVFPSTRLIYKGMEGTLRENSLKEFKTVYAINKFACEQYLEQFHNIFGVKYTIFRICVPYGSLVTGALSYGTAEFMLSKATKGENIFLYGAGSSRRTLTYIGDLCKILIEGALSEKCLNDVFNIGGEDYSLKEMASLIAKKYGVEIEYTQWPEVALKIESGDTVFDDTKLQSIIAMDFSGHFKKWISE